MKKKIITGILIVVFIVLMTPVPAFIKDGGSVQFKALLYEVTKYHVIDLDSETGYMDGWGIKLLGVEVFNNTKYAEDNYE